MAAALFAAPRYAQEQVKLDGGVSLIILRDDVAGVEAAVAPGKGGELSGLRVQFRGAWHELLYRARSYTTDPGWQGKAPLLWPAVGRNFSSSDTPDSTATECSYDYAGKRYQIPIHGFARFKSWRVIETGASQSNAHARLALSDDAETRSQFPFGFEHDVTYRLHDGCVTIVYCVKASAENQAPMFFSIGNHLTFRVPLIEGSLAAASTFQSPSGFVFLKDQNGSPAGGTLPRSYSEPVPVSQLIVGQAVSLGGYEQDPWIRLGDATGFAVRVSHHAQTVPETPFVQFNLWGVPNEGFFSPEPWIGLQNSLNTHNGLVHLAPGKTWTWTVQIEPEQNR